MANNTVAQWWLRIMPVDNYCEFYIPDSEKQVVSIVRVMFGGRDIDTELMET